MVTFARLGIPTPICRRLEFALHMGMARNMFNLPVSYPNPFGTIYQAGFFHLARYWLVKHDGDRSVASSFVFSIYMV